EAGECSSRYFFQLEKSRFKETLLDCIDVEGTLVHDQTRIKHEIGSFFSSLFASRQNRSSAISLEFFLSNPHLPRLSEEQNVLLGAPFSDVELLRSLFSMPSNKAPGL